MWRRTLALLIDLTPIIAVAGIENAVGIADHDLVGLLNLLLIIGYFAGMNYRFGGTIGKRVVGLRVAFPSCPDVLAKVVIRALVKVVCLFPPIVAVYALIGIWREDGRSLADFASNSTVVEASSLAPPIQASIAERVFASILVLLSPCMLGVIVTILGFGALFVHNWEELRKLFL